MPALMRDGDITLRAIGPFAKRRDISAADGLAGFKSMRRLKKALPLCYYIEAGTVCIGLAGMRDIRPGKSAEAALIIFSTDWRRRGYGSRAFRLLAKNLKTRGIFERLTVRVEKENPAAISFWRKMGFFVEKAETGEKTITEMRLDMSKEDAIGRI
ncbi:MAG: GNAT family N-acetyltransferase [Nitrospiraceae bacterium]|nr:GNAT family N-acetyltransferase [Nitrospiraceae bacterium]